MPTIANRVGGLAETIEHNVTGWLTEPGAEAWAAALAALGDAPQTGETARAQFSLYVMGAGDHMAEIMGCIDFLKSSGTFDRSKNFCTRLIGDSGPVFATLQEAFCRFGPPAGHVTIDLTVTANSPSIG